MLNFCAVMLKFCQPIFASSPTPKLAKIDPLYCSLPTARLDFDNETCMALGCLHGRQPSIIVIEKIQFFFLALDERIGKAHERFFVEGNAHRFVAAFAFVYVLSLA